MPPIWAYSTNLVTGNHLGATAVGHGAALEIVILVLMQFLVVAEPGALGYYCHGPGLGRDGSGMITRPMSDVALIITASLSFSLYASLTRLPPIRRIGALLRSTLRPYVQHLELPLRLFEAFPSCLPASPGVVVNVLGEDLDTEGDWDLSDVPPSGVIEISFSLLGDFSLAKMKGNEFSLICRTNAKDVF